MVGKTELPNEIHIKICNWDNYQKNDTRLFYRVNTSHIFDTKIQQLTDSQYRLWHTLLSHAGMQHKGGSVSILAPTMRSLAHIKGVSTHTQLSKLSELGLIEIQKERKRERKKDCSSLHPKKKKKEESPFVHPKNSDQFINMFPKQSFDNWIESYPDYEWLLAEMRHAFTYFYINQKADPSQTLRDWKCRMTNWFKRGWANHKNTKRDNGSIPAARGYTPPERI